MTNVFQCSIYRFRDFESLCAQALGCLSKPTADPGQKSYRLQLVFKLILPRTTCQPRSHHSIYYALGGIVLQSTSDTHPLIVSNRASLTSPSPHATPVRKKITSTVPSSSTGYAIKSVATAPPVPGAAASQLALMLITRVFASSPSFWRRTAPDVVVGQGDLPVVEEVWGAGAVFGLVHRRIGGRSRLA